MDQTKVELITAKEFRQHMEQPGFEKIENGRRIGYELSNGILIDVPTRTMIVAELVTILAARLTDHIQEYNLGHVMLSVHTEVSPDSMRVAQIAYVSCDSLDRVPKDESYMPFSPELVIEVVTPAEKAEVLEEKVDMFLQGGARLVWVVYPKLRKVVVRRPDGTAYQVTSDQILTGDDLLPDLEISLQSVFAELE